MSGKAILFNSPALHSLKRSQLVKICKRYGLKANGKNAELVARLQEYARTMPNADITDGMDENEEETEDDDVQSRPGLQTRMPPSFRPSEPWEIIQEDSREDINMSTINSQRSGLAVSTSGEFGAESGNIPKSSSVSSSFKAIAQSLRKAGTSLKTKSSSGQLLDIEVQGQPTSEPLPSPELHEDSDDSVDIGPIPSTYCPNPELASSTIRLILSSEAETPSDPADTAASLAVTQFERGSQSPADSGGLFGGSHDHKRKSSVYPELPEFALITAASSASTIAGGFATTIPGAFPPSLPPTLPTASRVDQPDALSAFAFSNTFASPVRKVGPRPSRLSSARPNLILSPSSADTNSAAISSVMEEMNRRMGADSRIGTDLFTRTTSLFPPSQAPKVETKDSERFQEAHEILFNRMESIVDYHAARQSKKKPSNPSASTLANKRKSNGPGIKNRQRPSFAGTPKAEKRRSRASIAIEARNTAIGGAIGARRQSRALADTPGPRNDSNLPSAAVPNGLVAGPAAATPSTVDVPTVTVVQGSASQKKKIEQSKARRRSSVARQSMGRQGIIGAAQTKPPVSSRFGFLKSGAKLVRSVFGGGQHKDAKSKEKEAAPRQQVASNQAGSLKIAPSTVSTQSSSKNASNPIVFGSRLTTTTFKPPKTESNSVSSRKESVIGGGTTRKSSLASVLSPQSGSRLPVPSPLIRQTDIVASGSRLPIHGSTVTDIQGSVRSSKTTLANDVAQHSNTAGSRASLANPPGTTSRASVVGSRTVSSSTSASINRSTSLNQNTAPLAVKRSTTTPVRFSTLTAPTASSLAKLQSNIQPPSNIPSLSKLGAASSTPRPSSIRTPSRGGQTTLATRFAPLEPITNTAAETHGGVDQEADPATSMADFGGLTASTSTNSTLSTTGTGSKRRRPRVSRSKVIAKLGEMRAAEESSVTNVAMKRSSMAVVKNHRRSVAVGLAGTGPNLNASAARRRTKDEEIQMSMKKAIRRSEVASRKSHRAAGLSLSPRKQPTGAGWGGIKTTS